MTPSLSINVKQFNDTLRRAVKESSRAAVDVVNGHALGVIHKAIELTQMADREKMEATLGKIGTQLNYTKKGLVRKGKGKRGQALLAEGSFAARIVNARRRDFAGPDYMLHGNALMAAARKLIAARVRSRAFIKSGFLWAMRDILQHVKGGKRTPGDRQVKANGSQKGRAYPAREFVGAFGSGKFVVTIENTALIASGGKFQSKGHHNPLPVAERGMALAIAAENANMEAHLKKKMEEAMKKAGAL